MKKIILLMFMFFVSCIYADNLNNKFVDTTGTITPTQINNFNNQLNKIEEQYSNMDFHIIMISTTNGLDINDVATDFFNKQGFGTQKNNNGLLLLIAKDDKKFSIKPGLDIQSSFDKDFVHKVSISCVKPNFSKENYAAGIQCVMNNVTNKMNDKKAFNNVLLLFLLFLVILFIVFIYYYVKSKNAPVKSNSESYSSYGSSSSSLSRNSNTTNTTIINNNNSDSGGGFLSGLMVGKFLSDSSSSRDSSSDNSWSSSYDNSSSYDGGSTDSSSGGSDSFIN